MARIVLMAVSFLSLPRMHEEETCLVNNKIIPSTKVTTTLKLISNSIYSFST